MSSRSISCKPRSCPDYDDNNKPAAKKDRIEIDANKSDEKVYYDSHFGKTMSDPNSEFCVAQRKSDHEFLLNVSMENLAYNLTDQCCAQYGQFVNNFYKQCSPLKWAANQTTVSNAVSAISTCMNTVFTDIVMLQAAGKKIETYCEIKVDAAQCDIEESKKAVNAFRDFGEPYKTAIAKETITEAVAVLGEHMLSLFEHIAMLEKRGVMLRTFINEYHWH
jgi:hypothetical protein